MPRYFFDYVADGVPSHDPDGLDLPDRDAALVEADRALEDIRQDMMVLRDDQLDLAIQVRDDRHILFRVETNYGRQAKDSSYVNR